MLGHLQSTKTTTTTTTTTTIPIALYLGSNLSSIR